MDRLYLLRHGIALPHGTPDISDDDRPLTEQGEKRARQIAYGLKHLSLEIDRIVTSPLPRAFRTAEIVARVIGDPDGLEIADALTFSATAASIAEWLKTREEGSLLIVGHNPSLSELIGLLVTGDARSEICELRRGGIAALIPREGSSTRWAIDWIARPKLIRRVSDR